MNETLQIKLKNLPDNPGVYIFRDKAGKIVYIGKAKNLKNRVRSYFNNSRNDDPKTMRLVAVAHDLELMVTDSEVEALILEANLVREHKPRYNVDLKDDKHFPYIKVTVNEPFPRVLVVRRLEKDGAKYFGPYASSKGMRRTINFLCRLFKIRTCNLIIPHPTGKKQKVCLDYHIGRCYGPCEEFQTAEDYRQAVDAVLLFLMGRSQTLIDGLKEKMQKLSEEMEFEEAAEVRDQIEALESVRQKQKVDVAQLLSRDIVAFAREAGDTVAVVFQVREGVLVGRQDFHLKSDADEADQEVLYSFVRQYYNNQPNLPDEIFLPLRLEEEDLVSEWLAKIGERKIKIFTPQIGEKVRLVEMASSNARLLLDELLIQKEKFRERTSKAVQALKDDLHLAESPLRIACVDISNTGESDAVGSLVYFENARPKKGEYRHFKIKEVKGQDDFAMMREVVGRYFFRLKEEAKKAPDLLLEDGGKWKLMSVVREIGALGFKEQSIIGLAKRLEEIYFPGKKEPLTLPKSSPGLGLLKTIRDEAHRFAIEYNRKVRGKRTIKSALDKLEGIGPKRREILLKHFGSVKKIREATLEELSAVKGVPKPVAEKVYRAFH